jgi:hypothetical protein
MTKKTKEELMDIEVKKLMSKPTEVKKKRTTITAKGDKKGLKPEWFLLNDEGNSEMINKLMRVYKENPYHAYVLNKNNAGVFTERRTLLFIYSEKHFELVKFEKRFGMSKTHMIYSTKKKVFSIIYKDNKMWYYLANGKVKTVVPLTINKLKEIICNINNKNIYSIHHDEFISKLGGTEFYKFLDTKFFWFKTLMEYRFGNNLTINTIISKKLFGFDKLNRHVFKINKSASTRLINSDILFEKINNNFLSDVEVACLVDKERFSNLFYNWKKILNQFDDLEHFDFNIIKQNEVMFFDTLNMAEKLNKKISGRWGLNKLKSMHDLWSIEIQNILLECEVERNLKIVKVFDDFAKFSGYKLMKTNKDLLREGMRHKHCVGTYIDRVDNGECAIYDVDEYTLQLVVLEFSGFKNSSVLSEKLVHCFNAVQNVTDSTRKKLRSNYQFKYKPEYDDLIKNGFWLHNVQFKGKFNKEAPEELFKKVQKKLYEFSLNYDFESIYEKYKQPTQDVLEYAYNVEDMGF